MLIQNKTGIYFPKKNISFNSDSSALQILTTSTEKKSIMPSKKPFDYKKASIFAGVFVAAVGSLVYFVKRHKKIKINSEIGQTINNVKKPTSVVPQKVTPSTSKVEDELQKSVKEYQENLDAISANFANGIMCPDKEIIKEMIPAILDRKEKLMQKLDLDLVEKYLQQINKDNYKFIKEDGLDLLADNMEKILEISETHSNAAKILGVLNPENKEFLPFLLKDPETCKIIGVRDITRCLFSLNGKDKDFITKEIMPLIKDNHEALRLADTQDIALVLKNITKENKSILTDCVKEKKSILQALGLE